jgi:hypothetical protein
MDAIPKVGECRYWFSTKPLAEQPEPKPCDQLSIMIPAGAWYVRHPNDGSGLVYVTILKAGTVVGRHIVSAETGREVVPK